MLGFLFLGNERPKQSVALRIEGVTNVRFPKTKGIQASSRIRGVTNVRFPKTKGIQASNRIRGVTNVRFPKTKGTQVSDFYAIYTEGGVPSIRFFENSMWQSDRKGLEVPDPRQKNPKHPITTLPCVMHDYFHARTRVHSAITLTATLALMLCFLYVRDSTSLSINPTYRIERCLLF